MSNLEERVVALETECAKLRAGILDLLEMLPHASWRKDGVRRKLGEPEVRYEHWLAQQPLEVAEELHGIRDGLGRVAGRDVEVTL